MVPDGVPAHLQAVAFGPLVMVVLAPAYFGEEFGWTAYLQGALADISFLRDRPTTASAGNGAVWGGLALDAGLGRLLRLPTAVARPSVVDPTADHDVGAS